MERDELQPTYLSENDGIPLSVLSDTQSSTSENRAKNKVVGPRERVTAEDNARDTDPMLRTLVIMQRQQREQAQLLRQLLQEIELLKNSQEQQRTTVTKLDRRLRRARIWRLSWFITRWSLLAAGLASIVYLIGIEQIMNFWERLLWLLT